MNKEKLHKLVNYLNLKDSTISESLLLKRIIILSVICHFIFYLFLISSPSVSFPDEWSMQTDLASFDMESTQNLKDSKYQVSDKMLPQLPKNFSIQDDPSKKDEDDLIDPSSKDKKEEEKLKQKKEKDNLIAKNEALKRLAIERLRQKQKENSDEKKELLSRLKGVDLDNLGGGSGSGSLHDSYKTQLESHIKKFWVLPDGYDFQHQDIKVEISVSLNMIGNITKTNITKSSGNNIFDEFALSTLKNASPFPPPPQSLQGKSIKLIFTPRSF